MWELHPTRPNQYAQHWFRSKQAEDRSDTAVYWTPLPSCKDQACGFWSTCYDCNDCPATLLVDKAEFIARKEFESEQDEPPKKHPNTSNTSPISPVHPNTPFYYSHLIEPDDFTNPERRKDAKWRSSKSL
jgi:hypothetical protein